MRQNQGQFITLHIGMDKDYASAMDGIGARLGVTSRTEVVEAALLALAVQMGISDLPDRLPSPARQGLQRTVKVS